MEHSLVSYAVCIMNEAEFMTSARYNVVSLLNSSGLYCGVNSRLGQHVSIRPDNILINKDFSKFYGRVERDAVKFDTSISERLTTVDLPLSI